jgi:hypothetical protein
VELTRGPFRGSQARRDGLLTQRQLQGNSWRRLFRDVYVHRDVPDTPQLRLQATGLIVPLGAVVYGTTAAWLHGADILRGPPVVEAAVPPNVRLDSREGLAVYNVALAAEDVTVVHGLSVTTPLRTAFDVARRPSPRNDPTEQLVVIDALSHRALFTPEGLAEFAHRPRLAGTRGRRQVAGVAAMVEPRTESPGETGLRMRIVRAGLPRPTAQVEVFDDEGVFLARVDFAYEELKLAVEYDGEGHRDRWAEDLARGNRLRAVGWELLSFTARDLASGRDTIPRQVRAALVRRTTGC